MLAGALQACCEPEHLRFGEWCERLNGHDPRLSLGDCACLVDEKRVDLLHGLERLGIADEDARGRAPSRAHHDAHRGGETECARASDDQDGHGIHQRVRESRFRSDQHPGREGQPGDSNDDGHEPTRYLVRKSLDGRAAPLRLADHAHDLRQQGRLADALGAHHQAPRLVDRRAGDPAARALFDRGRFPRDHRLVDAATPLDDEAVDGHLLARADPEQVAGHHLREWDVVLGAVLVDAASDLRSEPQQCLERPARSRPRSKLEDLAEEDEGNDERRRLEVDGNHSAAPHCFRKKARGDGRDDTEYVRDTGTESDQREHVEASVHDRCPAALEQGPACPEDHGRRQHQLDPRQPMTKRVLDRRPRQEFGHAEQKHRHREDEARPEPPAHVVQVGIALVE